MNQPTPATRQTTLTLLTVFIAQPLLLVGVAFLIGLKESYAPWTAGETILCVLAAASAAGAYYWHQKNMRLPDVHDLSALPSPEQWRTHAMICASMAELTSLFGFVMAIGSGRVSVLYGATIAAVALIVGLCILPTKRYFDLREKLER